MRLSHRFLTEGQRRQNGLFAKKSWQMFGQETFYENGLLFLHSQTFKIEGKLENSESKRETNGFDVALINGGT